MSEPSIDDRLQALYKSNDFPGVQKLYLMAKNAGFKVSQSQVRDFLKGQETAQLHHQAPRKDQPKHILTFDKNIEFQADLLDFQKHAHANGGHRFILIVEDIFTRKAFAYPLKTKHAKDVAEGFDDAFKFLGQPKMVTTDSGGEFKSAVDALLKERHIVHHTTEPGNHNVLGIIDALSKNFKSRLNRWFTASGETNWIDRLDAMVKSYNSTPHAALNNNTPNGAEERPWDVRVIQADKVMVNRAAQEGGLQVGDKVRVKKRKETFEKGYTTRWSKEIFEIVGKDGFKYKLSDGRSFTIDRLQKVKVPAAVSKPAEPAAAAAAAASEHPVERDTKAARQKRILREEGVNPQNKREGLRERKPQNQVEDTRFGKINW